MIDWKKRMQNRAFWVAVFALIAITGKTFNVYQVPVGWDMWVNSVLILLTLMGVIIDPTTNGISDK